MIPSGAHKLSIKLLRWFMNSNSAVTQFNGGNLILTVYLGTTFLACIGSELPSWIDCSSILKRVSKSFGVLNTIPIDLYSFDTLFFKTYYEASCRDLVHWQEWLFLLGFIMIVESFSWRLGFLIPGRESIFLIFIVWPYFRDLDRFIMGYWSLCEIASSKSFEACVFRADFSSFFGFLEGGALDYPAFSDFLRALAVFLLVILINDLWFFRSGVSPDLIPGLCIVNWMWWIIVVSGCACFYWYTFYVIFLKVINNFSQN